MNAIGRRGLVLTLAALLLLAGPRVGCAHPALFTTAQVYIQPDGQFQFFTSFDLLAFALQKTSLEIGDPPMNVLLDGPPTALARTIDASRTYFLAHLVLKTDKGAAAIARVKYPALAEVEAWKASGVKPRLPVVARVEVDGTLPARATFLQFQFPTCLGLVVLTMDRPGTEPYDEPVEAGTASSQIPVRLQ